MQQSPRGLTVPDGVMLAALPLGGYALTFAFEAGFADVYRIPWSLISLNITGGLAAGALLLISFLALAYMTPPEFIDLFSDTRKSPLVARVAVSLGIFDIFLIRYMHTGVLILINVIVMIAAIAFAARFPNIEKPFSNMLNEAIDQWAGPRAARILGALFAALIGAYLVGRINGESAPAFFIRTDATENAVLRIYGDVLVTAPMHAAGDHGYTIGRELRIRRITDVAPLIFVPIPSSAQISLPYRSRRSNFSSWLFPVEL